MQKDIARYIVNWAPRNMGELFLNHKRSMALREISFILRYAECESKPFDVKIR